MNPFLSYALAQPAMLVVPAVGFGLSLLVARVKTRYVRDGVFFGRSVRPQPSGKFDVSPADAQWDLESCRGGPIGHDALGGGGMKIEYDDQNDILHIEFSSAPIVRDVSPSWNINLGYSDTGLAEITILDAKSDGYWPIENVKDLLPDRE